MCAVSRSYLYQYQRTQKELLSCWNLKSHQRTCHTGKNPGVGLHDRLHQFQSQTTISQIKRWFNFERSTANIKHHQLKKQYIYIKTATLPWECTSIHIYILLANNLKKTFQTGSFRRIKKNLKQECLLAF